MTLRAAVLAGAVALALAQAARFSQVCRVFAPVYRQTTVYGGGSADLAYGDVLAAWRDYLAHWNVGRGVELVDHSQGASSPTRAGVERPRRTPGSRASAALPGRSSASTPPHRAAAAER